MHAPGSRVLSCEEVRALWLDAAAHLEQELADDPSVAASASVGDLGTRLDGLIAAESEHFAGLSVEPGCSGAW